MKSIIIIFYDPRLRLTARLLYPIMKKKLVKFSAYSKLFFLHTAPAPYSHMKTHIQSAQVKANKGGRVASKGLWRQRAPARLNRICHEVWDARVAVWNFTGRRRRRWGRATIFRGNDPANWKQTRVLLLLQSTSPFYIDSTRAAIKRMWRASPLKDLAWCARLSLPLLLSGNHSPFSKGAYIYTFANYHLDAEGVRWTLARVCVIESRGAVYRWQKINGTVVPSRRDERHRVNRPDEITGFRYRGFLPGFYGQKREFYGFWQLGRFLPRLWHPRIYESGRCINLKIIELDKV